MDIDRMEMGFECEGSDCSMARTAALLTTALKQVQPLSQQSKTNENRRLRRSHGLNSTPNRPILADHLVSTSRGWKVSPCSTTLPAPATRRSRSIPRSGRSKVRAPYRRRRSIEHTSPDPLIAASSWVPPVPKWFDAKEQFRKKPYSPHCKTKNSPFLSTMKAPPTPQAMTWSPMVYQSKTMFRSTPTPKQSHSCPRDNWFSISNSMEGVSPKKMVTCGAARFLPDTEAKRVSSFAFIEKLGSGSFSDVFKCKNKSTGEIVAIKKSLRPLKSESQVADVEARLRMLDTLTRDGLHENVVHYRECWREEGYCYIEMEYCANGNLEQYLAKLGSNITEDDVWGFIYDIASALVKLHKNRIIHCDIKPENILVNARKALVLADFGLARSLDNTAHCDTEGDGRYLAPEVLAESLLHCPGDIFAFGITLYEIVTGNMLEQSGSLWDVLRTGVDPPMAEPMFEPSASLRNLIKAMLAPQYEKRPTAKDLLRLPEVQSAAARKAVPQPTHQLTGEG